MGDVTAMLVGVCSELLFPISDNSIHRLAHPAIGLLEPEGLDRIQPRGLAGGIEAEEDPHCH